MIQNPCEPNLALRRGDDSPVSHDERPQNNRNSGRMRIELRKPGAFEARYGASQLAADA